MPYVNYVFYMISKHFLYRKESYETQTTEFHVHFDIHEGSTFISKDQLEEILLICTSQIALDGKHKGHIQRNSGHKYVIFIHVNVFA